MDNHKANNHKTLITSSPNYYRQKVSRLGNTDTAWSETKRPPSQLIKLTQKKCKIKLPKI